MTIKSTITEDKQAKNLYKAVAQLKTASEVEKFMRDLCSRTEIETMAERWNIVQYLKDGIAYRTIAEKTGASTATITRVAQWLHHGMGGYELMLNRSTRGSLTRATDIIATHLKSHKAIDKAKKEHRRQEKTLKKALE